MTYLRFVVFVAALTSFQQAEAQNLAAVECRARLQPRAYSSTSALYDGEDTVYLFGWLQSGIYPSGATYKYSISQDTIRSAGQIPTEYFEGNSVMNGDKNIYYFGATVGLTSVFQYNPTSQTFRNVSSLPFGIKYFPTIQPDSETALLFTVGELKDSKFDDLLDLTTTDISSTTQNLETTTYKEPEPTYLQVFSLNLTLFETVRVAEMQMEWPYGSYISAMWVEEAEAAFIFTGNYKSGQVTKFHRSTSQLEILPNYFPPMRRYTRAVWDGNYGYLIGGTNNTYFDSLIQFDPFTGESKEFRITGYPDSGWGNSRIFQTAGAVYVEKLNRIYMFGGLNTLYNSNGESYRHHDKIWYISLDPIDPPVRTTTITTTEEHSTTEERTTTALSSPRPTLDPEVFDCFGLRGSEHPFPGDCSKFILCKNNHGRAFDCPEPLLFHAERLKCTWPELVDCEF